MAHPERSLFFFSVTDTDFMGPYFFFIGGNGHFLIKRAWFL